jgi:RES domain-containing protein
LTTLDKADLPVHWRRDPAPPELAVIGNAWVTAARAAVLAVPSAIIEDETNFLLNPAHPDFSKIRIGDPQAFEFDPRLIK